MPEPGVIHNVLIALRQFGFNARVGQYCSAKGILDNHAYLAVAVEVSSTIQDTDTLTSSQRVEHREVGQCKRNRISRAKPDSYP